MTSKFLATLCYLSVRDIRKTSTTTSTTTTLTTGAPTTSTTTMTTTLAECSGTAGWIADGYCDDINNNMECSYDGGDCCGPNANTQYCRNCSCLDPNGGNGGNTTNTAASTTGNQIYLVAD